MQPAKSLSVLKVFAEEEGAVAFDRGGYYQRIVPRQGVPFADSERLRIESLGGMDGHERTKNCGQVILGLRHGHGLREAPEGDIEEFLSYLKTYDALSRRHCPPDEFRCSTSLGR